MLSTAAMPPGALPGGILVTRAGPLVVFAGAAVVQGIAVLVARFSAIGNLYLLAA